MRLSFHFLIASSLFLCFCIGSPLLAKDGQTSSASDASSVGRGGLSRSKANYSGFDSSANRNTYDDVVFNVKTHKFHSPVCSAAIRCTASCITVSRSRAHQMGAIPCGLCHGGELPAPSQAYNESLPGIGFSRGLQLQQPANRSSMQYGSPASIGSDNDSIVYNLKTHKFHSPVCAAAIRCTASCITLTRGQAHQRGAIPCGICHGGEL